MWATVRFSRGLFGKPPNPAHVEKVLRDLSLWDKKDSQDHDAVRRHEAPRADRQGAVARAAHPVPRRAHAPASTSNCARTCGRWCARCATSGVTIILTTHYIEEAEEMADRIGVINKGELILVEEKTALMRKLGKKQLTLQLRAPLDAVPAALSTQLPLELTQGGHALVYTYDTQARAHRHHRAARRHSREAGIGFQDLTTSQSSLEDIFVEPGEASQTHERSRRSAPSTASRWRARVRTLLQSIVSPVLSTSLYFVVFGSAIGSRIAEIDGDPLRRLHRAGARHAVAARRRASSNAAFGIYFPQFTGTIYELLSAPVSSGRSRARLCRRRGDASRSCWASSSSPPRACSCRYSIAHPLLDAGLPRAHGRDVQPVRLHHRHLGRRFRETADHPDARAHAADLPRRQRSTRSTCSRRFGRRSRCSTRSSI